MGSILLRIRDILKLTQRLKPFLTRDGVLLRVIRLNHTYPFLSGIGISLATNIFVSLAIEGGIAQYLALFLSGLLMLASGSLFMWLLWRTHAHGRGLPKEDKEALDYFTTIRTHSPDVYSRVAWELLGGFILAVSTFILGLVLLIPYL